MLFKGCAQVKAGLLELFLCFICFLEVFKAELIEFLLVKTCWGMGLEILGVFLLLVTIKLFCKFEKAQEIHFLSSQILSLINLSHIKKILIIHNIISLEISAGRNS